jgi:hypothetical protein
MKLDSSLEPFRAAVESLQHLLEKFNNQGVIIEGIAVGFLGKPRFTADVDAVFLLSVNDIPNSLHTPRRKTSCLASRMRTSLREETAYCC